MEQQEVATIMALLEGSNIPLEKWGHGGAKTVHDLVRELSDGECELKSEGKNMLVRYIKVVRVKVLMEMGGALYELVEVHQVMPDGSGRLRASTFGSGLGEKLHRGEDPVAGAARAVSEELFEKKFCPPYEDFILIESFSRERLSDSYPGIYNKSEVATYNWKMPVELYRSEGYQELKENGQRTVFKWKVKA